MTKKTKRETKFNRAKRLCDEAVALAEELQPKQRAEIWSSLAHRGVGRLMREVGEVFE